MVTVIVTASYGYAADKQEKCAEKVNELIRIFCIVSKATVGS